MTEASKPTVEAASKTTGEAASQDRGQNSNPRKRKISSEADQAVGRSDKAMTEASKPTLEAASKTIGQDNKEKRKRRASQAKHTAAGASTEESKAIENKTAATEVAGSKERGNFTKESKRSTSESAITTTGTCRTGIEQSQTEESYKQCVLATKEITNPKPKRSYKQLLADCTVLKKVKEEKVEENNENKQTEEQDPVLNKGWLKPRKPMKGNRIKTGMEVGLTSPNSLQLIALGTIQDIEDEEFVEVQVNIVFKSCTVLPKAKGRMTTVGQAEAHCISWPKKNVTEPEMDTINGGIVKHIVDKEMKMELIAGSVGAEKKGKKKVQTKMLQDI